MDSSDLSLDHSRLTFGKYKGLTPDEISEFDPSYVVWMAANIKPVPCSAWLVETCKDDIASNKNRDEDTEEVDYDGPF